MTAAIILGIIGLVMGFAQWQVNRQDQWLANEDVKQFNKDEAEKNRDWQEEQYKKYESVAAQMQQRQQAGLSPYENIASMSVGSGSTASSSANQISPLSLPDASLFSQLPGMVQQTRQTKLQNKLLDEQIKGAKLDNDTKTMNNIKLAIETNDFSSYYSLVKQSIEKGNELTDNQIKESFERARAQQLENDQMEDFIEGGGNIFEDAHGESVARISKILNDIKNDNIRVSNETALNKLQMTLMKSKGNYDLKILEKEAQLAENTNTINKLFDVDYSALPDYLKVSSQSLLGLCLQYQKGKISSDDLTKAINLFNTEVDKWQENATNASTPGYLTDWEKDKQKSQFMVDYGNLLIKIATGGALIAK